MNTSNGYGPIAQPGTSATFDLGAQPVNSTSAWICVGVVQARVGNIGQAGNGARPIAVQGLVGAGGALAHFKITQAAVVVREDRPGDRGPDDRGPDGEDRQKDRHALLVRAADFGNRRGRRAVLRGP